MAQNLENLFFLYVDELLVASFSFVKSSRGICNFIPRIVCCLFADEFVASTNLYPVKKQLRVVIVEKWLVIWDAFLSTFQFPFFCSSFFSFFL